jgi:hypothetical protein
MNQSCIDDTVIDFHLQLHVCETLSNLSKAILQDLHFKYTCGRQIFIGNFHMQEVKIYRLRSYKSLLI